MGWLIKDWLPTGHRAEVTAPEGQGKTILSCERAICIASGHPHLGHQVTQGPVLIVDEETPEASLKCHLDRFSLGFGYGGYPELPIEVLSMTGFRFGRKVESDRLLDVISSVRPVLIILDSLISMLPGGRQAISENDCHLGETIRDDLNRMLAASPGCTISFSVHTKKFAADLPLDELRRRDMQTLVRGHGSIVGEGCDTGFILKKLSEHPEPSRFAIITKARRQAIPMAAKVVYVEMEEEAYGQGWARLKQISPSALPPSELAKALYPLFLDGEDHSSQAIVRHYAFFTRRECHAGIIELLQRGVIVNGTTPQTYSLNDEWYADDQYLDSLKTQIEGEKKSRPWVTV